MGGLEETGIKPDGNDILFEEALVTNLLGSTRKVQPCSVLLVEN